MSGCAASVGVRLWYVWQHQLPLCATLLTHRERQGLCEPGAQQAPVLQVGEQLQGALLGQVGSKEDRVAIRVT